MRPFESLSEFKSKFRIAIILAITFGFIFGILKSTLFIFPNRYLQLKMYYSILDSALPIINHYLLVTVGIVVLVFVMLVALQSFLKFIGLNRKVNNIIACGIAPSLLIFTVGGYWINKIYLPGFFELKSVIGNIMWALICVLSVWALGWVIFKISQMRFNLPSKICNIKNSVGIMSLIVFFNAAHYFYPLSFKSYRPNLILISIDTLRADHLSCYGYNRDTSPNIDRFAKDGVLFTNTIAQSSWTLPSHMSLLTGLYLSSHSVTERDRKLSDEHLTLAEVLQNAGYDTVAFTDGGYVSHRFGYQGFDDFDDGGE